MILYMFILYKFYDGMMMVSIKRTMNVRVHCCRFASLNHLKNFKFECLSGIVFFGQFLVGTPFQSEVLKLLVRLSDEQSCAYKIAHSSIVNISFYFHF